MGNARATIWVMVCSMWFWGLADVSAASLDDGQTYNIDWSILQNMFFGGSDIVNLLPGGSITGMLEMSDESQLNISGGSISRYVDARHNSRVTMTDGSIGDHLRASGSSQITMSGGSIGSDLDAYANSRANISGGLIGDDLHTYSSSRVTICGGSIEGRIYTYDSSIVTFAGSNFAINGTRVAYGEYDTVGQPSMVGRLTGTLANGDPLDNVFTIYDDSSIVLAPGPSVEHPYCTGAIVGDLNGDCQVDLGDLAILAENWMMCNLEPESACWE